VDAQLAALDAAAQVGLELEPLERGFFTHAAGTPTDAASAAAIEAHLALVAGALAPYGAVALTH
jgi:hypothetical protein